jgi:catechol 2,3-dioxygenase-like lactoylglutathione lyase family enzyme
MNPAFKNLGATVLFVDDLDVGIGFYRDVLGLEMQFQDEVSAMFLLDSVALFVMKSERGSEQLAGEKTDIPRRIGTTALLCAPTDDVDALHEDLVGRGVHFITQPVSQPWGMRTANFKDPDGHVWEIFQKIG